MYQPVEEARRMHNLSAFLLTALALTALVVFFFLPAGVNWG